MSELKHVRDPVTGRCVACEALNKSGFLDTAYHPEAGLNTGSGLMVQQNQNRPVTPVVFDPSDPNYIRAIRRGSVSLAKGQGVYTHGAAVSQPYDSTTPSLVKRQSQPQILLLDAQSPPQQPSYRIVQAPSPSPSSGGGKLVLWQQAAANGGRVDPQPQQYSMATVATAAMKQPRPAQTVWVQPAGGAANIHGANFYPGQYGGARGGGVGGGGGNGGRGCCDGCRLCCLSCCVCCRPKRRGGGGGVEEGGPKRPYWSYEDGDSRGRCCKGWLIALCLLLILAAILAAILIPLLTLEAASQTVPLNRRYLLVNNDTLCQQQIRNGGTTLAGCAYTRAAELVVDSTFTNPPIIYSAAEANPRPGLLATGLACVAAVAMATVASKIGFGF